MEYKTLCWDDLAVKITLSVFRPEGNKAKEYHVMAQVQDLFLPVEVQFQQLESALTRLAGSEDMGGAVLVWKRYFLSDALNQCNLLPQGGTAATSIVQQAVLNGAKVALWAYWVEGAVLSLTSRGSVKMSRPNYDHLYTVQLHCRQRNEAMETYYIFDEYTEELALHDCTLKENCVRTWIYVHGVDVHYQRMANARKAYFEKEGLTDKTHYIASTGIEGKYIYPDSIVQMDAYAVKGLREGQITFLKGLEHLSPTIDYGVTFERATAVDYGDRRHIYVSGTGSLNNKSEVVYPGNILRQLSHSLENVCALLEEGGADVNNVALFVVYLRDTADYERVNDYMNSYYPQVPNVIVGAPFHRPELLVQVECIAVKPAENAAFPDF